MKEIKQWLIDNKFKISLIFLIYFVVTYTISIVNFPYIDDIGRKIDGSTSYAISYSRWGSEVLSWLIQGSRHLTDTGVTNHILTAMILTLTSTIALYLFFKDKKISYYVAAFSTLIGLNPFFLECIAFRFDSPFMSMSVMFGYLPFLFWNNKNIFPIVSILSVFLMCNTYQQSSGVFIVVALTMFIYSIILDVDIKQNIISLVQAAISFTLGMAMYLFETKFNPDLAIRGNTVAIAPLNTIFSKVISNSQLYIKDILYHSAKIWIVFYIAIIITFIIVTLIKLKNKNITNVILVLLYTFFAIFLSYGVLLVFEYPLVLQHTRYGEYGFGNYLALLILVTISVCNGTKLHNKFINIIFSMFLFYQISYCFTFAAMLDVQKDTFENNAVMLAGDLNELVAKNNPSKVYFNRLFTKPATLTNAERNFPILAKSIPSIGEVSWPNVLWFREVTGLNVDIPFEVKNYNDFSLDDSKIYKDTAKYRIYSLPNIIFVEMK